MAGFDVRSVVTDAAVEAAAKAQTKANSDRRSSALHVAKGGRSRTDKSDGRVVCIVDDDRSIRGSLWRLLTSVGFRVRTFESAEAFLDSVDGDIGCAVVDVQMIGMSGIDLLRHLATSHWRIPVIMLTAHADDATRRRSLDAGAVTFLEKPVQTPALLEAVRTALSLA